MTLLDDYQSAYKLRGIVVVRDMLARVPAGLLKRTGVAALLQTVSWSGHPRVLSTFAVPLLPRCYPSVCVPGVC